METKKFGTTSASLPWNWPYRTFASAVLLALCTLWLATPAVAANGRDFAAFYRFQKTSEPSGDDRERVTLELHLFNYSAINVIGGIVALDDPPLPVVSRGTITGFSIDEGASVTVSGTFIIPKTEYQRWLAGNGPHLRIEYTDAAGNLVRRPIELIPGQGIPPSGELQ